MATSGQQFHYVFVNDMERFSLQRYIFFLKNANFLPIIFKKKKRNNVGIIVVPRDSITWFG